MILLIALRALFLKEMGGERFRAVTRRALRVKLKGFISHGCAQAHTRLTPEQYPFRRRRGGFFGNPGARIPKVILSPCGLRSRPCVGPPRAGPRVKKSLLHTGSRTRLAAQSAPGFAGGCSPLRSLRLGAREGFLGLPQRRRVRRENRFLPPLGAPRSGSTRRKPLARPQTLRTTQTQKTTQTFPCQSRLNLLRASAMLLSLAATALITSRMALSLPRSSSSSMVSILALRIMDLLSQ